VKRQIINDQQGLCAYCETQIKYAKYDGEVDDFRVEHFYPKSGTENSEHNFHLDWQNMLGVCHGGSQPNVPDARERFSDRNIDRSCDVLKGNKNLTKEILNPLTLPVNRIWCYKEYDGSIWVDYRSCPTELIEMAENTIDELNLNAPRLCRMRKNVLEKLGDQLTEMVAGGGHIEDSLVELAESFLIPDKHNRCLPYFSAVRWYLGEAAENLLKHYC